MPQSINNTCGAQALDPEDPRCARLTLSGRLGRLTNASEETAAARAALFGRERHPLRPSSRPAPSAAGAKRRCACPPTSLQRMRCMSRCRPIHRSACRSRCSSPAKSSIDFACNLAWRRAQREVHKARHSRADRRARGGAAQQQRPKQCATVRCRNCGVEPPW